MTIGAIVIPLAALALCGAGMWLAWRLVRQAEGAADQAPPPRPSAVPAPLPSGPDSVRVVGQLMALAGAGLGGMGIAVALWRAFGWQPIGLVLVLAALASGMGLLAWRVLRRRGRRRPGT